MREEVNQLYRKPCKVDPGQLDIIELYQILKMASYINYFIDEREGMNKIRFTS